MSITPQGRSVQAMYRDYRDGKLIVNRRYQRKLVWTLEEKQKLIDSILHDYPIPLILLAELRTGPHAGKFEIIDGMQRLNSVFSFIEHAFTFEDMLFDLGQFSRARQAAEQGVFTARTNGSFLVAQQCSNILDYQLAITIYPATTDLEITEVFGRINAQGRQLSPQEQRQAGVANRVSTLVRQLASDIRGDVSIDVLDLANMPEISIEHEQSPHGYGIRAEDTLWCKQGILARKQLRDSEDEQMILDFVASIALGAPIAASRETFDAFYDRNAPQSRELEAAVIAYGEDRLRTELLGTFSVLGDMIARVSDAQNFLRSTIRPGDRNPIKGPFYAMFMAIFDLVVRQEKAPDRPAEIFNALNGVGRLLSTASHYATVDDRIRNINTMKGLIQDHFVARRPPAFTSGPGLAIQIENCLRRSQIETPRYEAKQGFLALNGARAWNGDLENRLVETACGIANLACEGDIFLGVADTEQHANRVEELDGIRPIVVGQRYVVGIDREASILGISTEAYMRRVVDFFRNSPLSSGLKAQVLGTIDAVDFRGFTLIRIHIPEQSTVSFVGNRCFTREGSETRETTGPGILAIQELFQNGH